MPSSCSEKVINLDCSLPVSDNILDINDLEQFYHDHIKVGGKTGNLSKVLRNKEVLDVVKIKRTGNVISITTSAPMKKRYLKYLTKMFFAKNDLRDYIRVLATDKQSYALRYFKVKKAVSA